LNNTLKDRRVEQLQDGQRKFIHELSNYVKEQSKKFEELKITNSTMLKNKQKFTSDTFDTIQKGKDLFFKIRQATLLLDDLRDDINTYYELTRSFENYLEMINHQKLGKIDIPSGFIIDITEFFSKRIETMRDKILEIQEIIEVSYLEDDSGEYEKIISVIEEMYDYFLDVSNKAIQLHEFKQVIQDKFVNYCKATGNYGVEKLFEQSQGQEPVILTQLNKLSENTLKKIELEQIEQLKKAELEAQKQREADLKNYQRQSMKY